MNEQVLCAFMIWTFVFFGPAPVQAEFSEERLAAGKIVALDEGTATLQVKTVEGSIVELVVDPYTTVIWKDNDYVEGMAALAEGDRLEIGYFMEEGRQIAGWIDVLNKEDLSRKE